MGQSVGAVGRTAEDCGLRIRLVWHFGLRVLDARLCCGPSTRPAPRHRGAGPGGRIRFTRANFPSLSAVGDALQQTAVVRSGSSTLPHWILSGWVSKIGRVRAVSLASIMSISAFGSDEGQQELRWSFRIWGHKLGLRGGCIVWMQSESPLFQSVINLITKQYIALIEADSAMEGMSEARLCRPFSGLRRGP